MNIQISSYRDYLEIKSRKENKMDLFLKFEDLKPEIQAEIHNQIMTALADGKDITKLASKDFELISLKADKIVKDLEITAGFENDDF
jgi:membrane protease subunit (stomatin/prohibitin family)